MAKKNYYAVKIGRKTGVFNNWADCAKSVNKYPGAVYQGFAKEEDARAFYLTHRIQKKGLSAKRHQQNRSRLSLLLTPMLTVPIMQKPVFMATEDFCVLEIRKLFFRETVMSLTWLQCIMLPERFWDVK